MSQASSDGRRIVLSVLILLVACWGVLGWVDLPSRTRAGFDTNGYNIVTRVEADSPAQRAGLQPGDRITHFDGVPVEDAARIARQPRKRVGDVQRVTVRNGRESKDVLITYGPMPQGDLRHAHAAMIVGLCFLLFPPAAFFRNAVEATRVLVVMGIGLSLAFMTGPYIAKFNIRALTVAITSLFVLVGVAAVLHFLLVFPQRRPLLDRSYGKKLLYFPAFVLWVMIAWQVLFTPTTGHVLNALTNTMAAVIIGVYLLLSLFQVLRNFSRTDQAQRKALRLNSMLLATVVGFVPATIAQLVFTFSPQSVLPGQHFYFITLALIPLSWARSASLLKQ